MPRAAPLKGGPDTTLTRQTQTLFTILSKVCSLLLRVYGGRFANADFISAETDSLFRELRGAGGMSFRPFLQNDSC